MPWVITSLAAWELVIRIVRYIQRKWKLCVTRTSKLSPMAVDLMSLHSRRMEKYTKQNGDTIEMLIISISIN